MLPASNSGVGMNVGFPDVCLTPAGPVPVPIPYPNMALNATAVPFAPNVLVSFVPGLNMAAEAPMTLGDQPGVASPFMGPGRYTMGNPIVMMNALPAVNLLCPTTGNNMVNPLGAVLVPSVTNVFYSHAGAPPCGALSAAAMGDLARAVSPAAVTMLAAPEGIVALAVPVLGAGTSARVYSALERSARDGREVTALILDLRGCPGGELSSAVALAGDFLDEGAVIVTATDGDGDETVYRAPRGTPYTLPLALLVDHLTASAAEIFAGSLQAHGRALVIGERTYGKGTAQQVLPGAHYATVATLSFRGSPRDDGGPLHGRGVQPDVTVPTEAALDAAVAWASRRAFRWRPGTG